MVQVKDRKIVAHRMKEHIQKEDSTPLLVFPEGTCVNNEYTVMFKRGAFDLDATVCPVAIKYNKIFVDAFWNSRRQPFTLYIVRSPPLPAARAARAVCAGVLPAVCAASRSRAAWFLDPRISCSCFGTCTCCMHSLQLLMIVDCQVHCTQ